MSSSSSALENTCIGWAGSNANLASQGSYIRIDGPRAWMEIVVQGPAATPGQVHYHAIWRDETLDYGGDGTLVLEPGPSFFHYPAMKALTRSDFTGHDHSRTRRPAPAIPPLEVFARGTPKPICEHRR